MDLNIDDYLLDFPEDKEVEQRWEELKEGLLSVSLTKKRLQYLRTIWRNYKDVHKNWKSLLKEISYFLEGKVSTVREQIPPYNPKRLKLVAVDFIS